MPSTPRGPVKESQRTTTNFNTNQQALNNREQAGYYISVMLHQCYISHGLLRPLTIYNYVRLIDSHFPATKSGQTMRICINFVHYVHILIGLPAQPEPMTCTGQATGHSKIQDQECWKKRERDSITSTINGN